MDSVPPLMVSRLRNEFATLAASVTTFTADSAAAAPAGSPRAIVSIAVANHR